LIGFVNADPWLRNVRAVSSNLAGATIFQAAGTSSPKMYDCIAESTTANMRAFYLNSTGSPELYRCQAIAGDTGMTAFSVQAAGTPLLEHCIADDTTNIATALLVADVAATVTTRRCTFRALTNDVSIGAAATWKHIKCEWDAANSTINGTETALPDGVTDIRSTGVYTTVAGDVYPQGSTYGLNARFEDIFGDDVPTRLTDFVRSAPLGIADVPGSNQLGFLTDTAAGADSYNPPAPFSKVNPGAVHFYVLNHHLRINSLASTSNLIWNAAAAQNWCDLYIQFATRRGVAYGGEIRGWDVQAPGAGDEYFAARFLYDAAGYPDWPWRVQLWTGTGTVFAAGDGVFRIDAPWEPTETYFVRFRATAGPRCQLYMGKYHSQSLLHMFDQILANYPVAWNRVQVHVATNYNDVAIDAVELT